MPTALKDAATVCVTRVKEGRMEVLLLRRPDKGTFPGAWVFPGGKVDPEDHEGTTEDEVVRRRAAVREAHEEAGLRIDPSALVLLSRWRPPAESPAQFDTWIYVCKVADDSDVKIDGSEIVDHVWIEPAAALSRHGRSDLALIPPTWVTIDLLAGYAAPDDALEAIAGREPARHTSRMISRGDERLLLWSGDIAYHGQVDVDAPGPRHRLSIGSLPWRYERSGLGSRRSDRAPADLP